MAIAKLENGKAAGIDKISAELHKTEDVWTLISHNLHKHFTQDRVIWRSIHAPTFWKTGLIVKLPKKETSQTAINYYRGIMLLSVISRVILADRATDIDPLLRTEQAGFRMWRSYADQFFTLKQVLEQRNKWNSPLYINFIDLTKAFESVNRPAIERILSHCGIPCKLISIIKMLYTDLNARVIWGTNLSDELKLKAGVKQGCLLPPP